MDVIAESAKLHSQAWSDQSRFTECLEQAAGLLKQAYESGDTSSLLVNNYAAVLLDLHRDFDALELLRLCDPDFSEFCANYAIAVAKAAYDIDLIRHWNQAASKYPKDERAIVAYMDWQGL
ncbi:hypothetical protein KUV59_17610 [Marinobacter daepoensis]|uniref:hypothetical protein n=1 Tax=Marinobacter daepoensis TaxID=262077 RepID=UPI001C96171B|nr:hypothetical protein [Marinobacter daepoensis]MBY6034995.1 hypothetical protein [Marinobacter daepoensis]